MLFFAFSWTPVMLISLKFAITILNIKPCLPKLLNLTVLVRITAFSPHPLQGRWVARPTWWARERFGGLRSLGAGWGQRSGGPGTLHWLSTFFVCLAHVNFHLWSLANNTHLVIIIVPDVAMLLVVNFVADLRMRKSATLQRFSLDSLLCYSYYLILSSDD